MGYQCVYHSGLNYQLIVYTNHISGTLAEQILTVIIYLFIHSGIWPLGNSPGPGVILLPPLQCLFYQRMCPFAQNPCRKSEMKNCFASNSIPPLLWEGRVRVRDSPISQASLLHFFLPRMQLIYEVSPGGLWNFSRQILLAGLFK